MKKVFTKKLAVLLAASLLTTGAFVSCSDGSGNGGDSADTPSKTGIAADSLPEPVGPSPVEDGLYGVTSGGKLKAVNIAARTGDVVDGTYTNDDDDDDENFYVFDTKERTMTIYDNEECQVNMFTAQFKYTYHVPEGTITTALLKYTAPADIDAYCKSLRWETDFSGNPDYIDESNYAGSWELDEKDDWLKKWSYLLNSAELSALINQYPTLAANFRNNINRKTREAEIMWATKIRHRYTKDDTTGAITAIDDDGDIIVLTPLK